MTTQTPIATTSPLAAKAMLVSFSISTWKGRKLDKAASAKTNRDHNAAPNAARVTKSLVGKAALAAILAIESKARAEHYARTLPWSNDGPRICSAIGYLEYVAAMRTLRDEFEAERAKLPAVFDSYVAQAQIELGDMFNPADYPAASEIAGRFSFPRPRVFPLPQAADFRVEIGATELAAARADIEASVNAMVADAMADVFKRIAETVGAMAAKLDEFKPAARKGDKTTGIFRDSLVENVRDLVKVLPSLNITGDARLADLAARMQTLCDADAAVLREHADVRADVAKRAAEIVSEVSAYF